MTMTEDRWYIKIDGKRQGPFSPQELRRDSRVTPETLVCKEGEEHWVCAGAEPRLEEIFQDLEAEIEEKDADERLSMSTPLGSGEGELTIELPPNPGFFLTWLLIVFLVLLYLLLQLS